MPMRRRQSVNSIGTAPRRLTRRRVTAAAIAAAALLFAGRRSLAQSARHAPERIVALGGAVTEILYALSEERRIAKWPAGGRRPQDHGRRDDRACRRRQCRRRARAGAPGQVLDTELVARVLRVDLDREPARSCLAPLLAPAAGDRGDRHRRDSVALGNREPTLKSSRGGWLRGASSLCGYTRPRVAFMRKKITAMTIAT